MMVCKQQLMNWNFLGMKTNTCYTTVPSSAVFFICLLWSIFKPMPKVLTGLCVLFLQFRVFGPGQASGQGVSGLLYPGGHSFRRTPRWGKRLSCTAQILTGCLYLSCFTFPAELNWVAARRETKSFTVKSHKQQLWCCVERRISQAIFWKNVSFSANSNHNNHHH